MHISRNWFYSVYICLIIILTYLITLYCLFYKAHHIKLTTVKVKIKYSASLMFQNYQLIKSQGHILNIVFAFFR